MPAGLRCNTAPDLRFRPRYLYIDLFYFFPPTVDELSFFDRFGDPAI